MKSLRAATEGQLKRALAADAPQLWRALRAEREDDARYWVVDAAEGARTSSLVAEPKAGQLAGQAHYGLAETGRVVAGSACSSS